nr:NAD(P)-binding domain-containing protein [uncultured Actinotalea sp.]
MSTVTILGTGTMGTAIAGLVEKAGHPVQLLGTADAATPVGGEIVVLAVPYPAVAQILAERGDQLAGRVVVDITNPVDFETFDSLSVPADSSAAAQIAAALPTARVLKGFNVNFAATLATGVVGDQVTTVLLAGDDADAKGQVAQVVEAAGLRVVDAGSLRRARELEALGFLQITLAAAEKTPWTGGFALQA